MIFFKHCYWPEAHKWGVLGLPKSQGAAKALQEYTKGDLVLVAQTKGMEGPYSGKVFGVCTLLSLTGSTRELGNPDAITPDDNEIWRECLVIDKYWHIDPTEYAEFGSEVAAQAKHNQGKLFKIEDTAAVQDWLARAPRTEESDIYRSPRALGHINDLLGTQIKLP